MTLTHGNALIHTLRKHRLGMLAALVLLMAPTGSLQAFGRLNVLVPGQRPWGRTPWATNPIVKDSRSGAILGDSVLYVDVGSCRICQISFPDRQTSVFAGTGFEGAQLDSDSALKTELGWKASLCPLLDGTLLVGDWRNHRVLRLRPQADQGPAKVSVFAGDGTEGFHLDPTSAQRTQLAGGNGLLYECQDGSILILNGDRILRVTAGGTQVSTLIGTGTAGTHFDPASAAATQLRDARAMAELGDGSILVLEAGEDCSCQVLRVRAGGVTVYAGLAASAEHRFRIPHHAGVLAVLPDRRVLVEGTSPHGQVLVTLGDGQVKTYSGPAVPATGAQDRDPKGLPADLAFPSVRSLASLPDGSLLVGTDANGILMLSPNDPFQSLLVDLYQRGAAAAGSREAGAFQQAKHELAFLAQPSQDAASLGAVMTPDELHELGLPAVLVNLIQSYAPSPLERLRASVALAELMALGPEGTGTGGTSAPWSSDVSGASSSFSSAQEALAPPTEAHASQS